jgi:hypothetical protein
VDIEYDLSRVMFVATANSASVPSIPRLRDRMEIIEVNGYTQEEKLEIAIRHLLPKQFTENGIKPKQLKLATGSYRSHHRSVHRREWRSHLGETHRQAGPLPRQADRVETEVQHHHHHR